MEELMEWWEAQTGEPIPDQGSRQRAGTLAALWATLHFMAIKEIDLANLEMVENQDAKWLERHTRSDQERRGIKVLSGFVKGAKKIRCVYTGFFPARVASKRSALCLSSGRCCEVSPDGRNGDSRSLRTYQINY